jgi:acyl dehydratase
MIGWFEDIAIGERREIGAHTFTAEEIIRFAKAYDPQPFHVDAEAAKASQFGALCASGWHTAAIWMRLNVADIAARGRLAGLDPASVMGPSPGFQDLTWSKPVYAGDTITFDSTVVEKRPLASRPVFGLVTHHNTGRNQAGMKVFAFTGHVFVRRRPG